MASCKRGKLNYSLNEFRSEFVFDPDFSLQSNSSSNAVRDLILCMRMLTDLVLVVGLVIGAKTL